jgi:CDP-glycerol glycerophosphotransferase
MIDYELRNKQLIQINTKNQENGKLIQFEVSFLKTLIEQAEEASFTLHKRGTHETISFTAVHLKDIEQMTVLKGDWLITDEDFNSFQINTIWDFYLELHLNDSDEPKQIRIKSNAEDIRLHSFIIRGDMFTPYRTDRGNVSFKLQSLCLLSQLENVDLKDSGRLAFSGYTFFIPELTKEVTPVEKKLIITNTAEEEELSYPLQLENREDLTEQYGSPGCSFHGSGFKGEIDLRNIKNTKQNQYLKFFIEMTLPNGEIFRSNRLNFHPRNTQTLRQFIFLRQHDKKIRVLVKTTAKSKYLSVRIHPYHAIKELAGKAKRFALRVKRGKRVKKLYKTVFKTFGMLPRKKNMIVFESFLGKQYSCNPRALYEYLRKNHPEYDMYWSVDPKNSAPFDGKGLKTINRFSISWLFKMARAKYWVSNSRLPLWIPKPAHTVYLQTWHGTPLKRLAADMDEVHMPGTNTVKYKRNFLNEASRWDYLISPNRYSSEIFARAFGFNKDMLESGYPRNDYLHNHNNPETIAEIKTRLNLPEDKQVILYAPTWRDNEFYEKGKYKFNLKLELDKMKKELGDDYIILLRMHYLIAENLDITDYSGFAYDVSHHTDISELYLISDLLITDYSSVFFDYANLKRPMIFFVYDIENYRDSLRGFYFDFEGQAPGPLVKTTEEVIHHVRNKDLLNQSDFDSFYEKFCYLESGQSSKRVVEEVFQPNRKK